MQIHLISRYNHNLLEFLTYNPITMKKALITLPILLLLSGCTGITPNYIKNAPAETSDEKTAYSSEDFDFSFEYPANWKMIEEPPSTIRIASPKAESLTKNIETEDIYDIKIFLRPNHDKLPLAEFYDGNNAVNLYEKAQKGSEEVEIAGIKGVHLKDVKGYYPGDIYIIPHGEQNIEFHYYIIDDKGEQVLKDLLASFKLKVAEEEKKTEESPEKTAEESSREKTDEEKTEETPEEAPVEAETE